MSESSRIGTIALLVVFLAAIGTGLAQQEEIGEGSIAPNPVPPPLPPPERPAEDSARYESVLIASDLPWGLDDSLLDSLFERAARLPRLHPKIHLRRDRSAGRLRLQR